MNESYNVDIEQEDDGRFLAEVADWPPPSPQTGGVYQIGDVQARS